MSLSKDIRLRPERPSDLPFLYQLYASTRDEELARVDWKEGHKEAFLAMQFTAQHRFYGEKFPNASFLIIERAGHSIGRLYVDRREEEIRLIDIALIPEERGHGIGSTLMSDLLREAEEARKPVRIHVESFNPALRLYERLGFTRIEDQGVYWLMEWAPKSVSPVG